MDPQTGIKLVEIEVGKSFQANGKIYTPSESFAIGRFEVVEELEEEAIQFADKASCHAIMLQAMNAINEMKPGEAYAWLYNKIEHDQRNAQLTKYTLRMCTAYINYEGEDIRYLTEETIRTKLEDWSAEGLDVRPFFLFAVNVFRKLLDNYKAPILSILQEAKSIREIINESTDIRNLIGTPANGQEVS